MICLDMLEYSLVSSVVKRGVDFLFVPSFFEISDRMLDTAKIISKHFCILALDNYHHNTGISSTLFSFGKVIEPRISVKSENCLLKLYDFDTTSLLQEKTTNRLYMSEYDRELFGFPRIQNNKRFKNTM